MYCHRYLQIKRPKLERFMIGYTFICTLLIGVYLNGGISKDMMATVWLPFNLATDAYLLYILWKLLRGAIRVAPVVLAIALAFFVVSDIHDRLIVTAAFGNLVGFDSTYWRSLAAVLLSFSFVLLVADQLINAIDDAKQSRAAREQAQATERSRITREIHDGIGAQLMTALRGVERGALSQDQISQSLQDGLDELRLLMDSADIGSDLHGALIAWRNRWEPRLNALQLTLDWHMADVVEQVKLPQEVVLQIIRILQESVANVVKHAYASKIEVAVAVQTGKLVLRISDNGVGLPAEQASVASRGMKNMKQRAEQIGANYSIQKIEAPAHGTQVELSLTRSG
jgi:signal transduction histidine kinase